MKPVEWGVGRNVRFTGLIVKMEKKIVLRISVLRESL